MTEPQSLAQDLFEDMRRKVDEAGKGGVGDNEQRLVEEIESLCMNCHEQGITKLLLTKIPFFREIVIMSFDCPHCGFHNSEVQPAGQIQQQGHKYTFRVERLQDLQRQIVKSDTGVFRIEAIDLEIPAGRGQLTNVEGILSMVAEDLQQKQAERKEAVHTLFEQVEKIISSLKDMAAAQNLPFAISVDDPAGNSWIEPSPQDGRGKYVRTDYNRTPEQNESLGLAPTAEPPNGVQMRPEYHPQHMYPQMPQDTTVLDQDKDEDEIIENQVYSFPATCPGCSAPCATNMKMVNIPHFKQVVLMSTVCEHCGYRSNEVKTGGEVPEKGRRITVSVEKHDDLNRDILKSESCAMACPELELQVEPGTLGGRFTTIEGLLTQVRDDLHASIFGDQDNAGGGDSMERAERERWAQFFARLEQAIKGERKFHVTLEDPLAGSYVQSFTAPDPDPQIEVEDYERTDEEEEALGLKDIKTEGYEQDGDKMELTEEERAKKFLDDVNRQ